MLILLAILVPFFGGMFHWSARLVQILTIGLGAGGFAMYYFLAAGRRVQPASDPELAGRVQAAAERFGWTGVEVEVIDRGLPLLRHRSNRLMVPVVLKTLLYDDELEAYIGFAAAHQPDAMRRAVVAVYLPWAAAILAGMVANRVTGAPWGLLVPIAFLAWYPLGARRGLTSGYAARIAVPRYVARGGNPEVLLRAMYKVYGETVRLGYRQLSVLGAMRTALKAVAAAGGLTPEQAAAKGREMGVPDVLVQLS